MSAQAFEDYPRGYEYRKVPDETIRRLPMYLSALLLLEGVGPKDCVKRRLSWLKNKNVAEDFAGIC
jgi:hypothetical protein